MESTIQKICNENKTSKNTAMFWGNISIRLIMLTIFFFVFYNVVLINGSSNYDIIIAFASIAVCLFVYEAFVKLYNGYKSGSYPVSEIIIAHMLASVFTDLVMWIFCSAYAKVLYKWYEFCLLLLCQVIVISFWAWIMNTLYCKLNVPRRLIVVNGVHGDAYVVQKLAAMDKKYQICQTFNSEEDFDLILKSTIDVDGVLLNRVEEPVKSELLKYCLEYDIRIYMVPEITDLLFCNSKILHQIDTPLLMYDTSLRFGKKLFLKRMFDFIFSMCAIVISSPIFLLVAAAIKLEDGGPVFFLQKRYTLNNREFNIIKFRSMRKDADNLNVLPTVKKDPRITKVGRVIRATRIDELPQLINIITGDMSLVGPRPERIEHVEIYTRELPEFKLRSKMRGGLTGYAQIYGKYNTTPYDKLCMDLMYIENWSLGLDLRLLLLTIKVCLKKESTEGFSEQMANHMMSVADSTGKKNCEKRKKN